MNNTRFLKNKGSQPVQNGVLVDVVYRNGTRNNHVQAGPVKPQDNAGSNQFFTAEDWTIEGVFFDIMKWRLSVVKQKTEHTLLISKAQLQSIAAEARNALRRLHMMRDNLEADVRLGKTIAQVTGMKVLNPQIYHIRDVMAKTTKHMVRIQMIVKDALKYGKLTRSDAQRLEKHQTCVLVSCHQDWENIKTDRVHKTAVGKRAIARLHRQIDIQRAIRKQLASM